MFAHKETITTTIKVNGMMCQHCVYHVGEALKSLHGVKNATVSLSDGKATITSTMSLTDEELTKALDNAGYGFGGRL